LPEQIFRQHSDFRIAPRTLARAAMHIHSHSSHASRAGAREQQVSPAVALDGLTKSASAL
jgi:hypothetical protein